MKIYFDGELVSNDIWEYTYEKCAEAFSELII